MADNYTWLDDARAHHKIYAEAIHHACICEWETDRSGPASDTEDMPAFKLVARRKHCVIHGVRGWL